MNNIKKRIQTTLLLAVLGASLILTGCSKTETEETTVRIGSLKGPTSMGLVELMDQAEKGEAGADYEFTMAAAEDEINAAF